MLELNQPRRYQKKDFQKQNSQKGCSMEAMNYVKPELIVVAFVLYFFGVALRQAPDADSRMEKSVSSPSAMVKKLQKWCNQK
jgi:hypothetical protein